MQRLVFLHLFYLGIVLCLAGCSESPTETYRLERVYIVSGIERWSGGGIELHDGFRGRLEGAIELYYNQNGEVAQEVLYEKDFDDDWRLVSKNTAIRDEDGNIVKRTNTNHYVSDLTEVNPATTVLPDELTITEYDYEYGEAVSAQIYHSQELWGKVRFYWVPNGHLLEESWWPYDYRHLEGINKFKSGTNAGWLAVSQLLSGLGLEFFYLEGGFVSYAEGGDPTGATGRHYTYFFEYGRRDCKQVPMSASSFMHLMGHCLESSSPNAPPAIPWSTADLPVHIPD